MPVHRTYLVSVRCNLSLPLVIQIFIYIRFDKFQSQYSLISICIVALLAITGLDRIRGAITTVAASQISSSLSIMHITELAVIIWLLVAASGASPCKPKPQAVADPVARDEPATTDYTVNSCTEPLVRKEW